MSGEKNLDTLLKSIAPGLIEGEYVFLSFQGATYGDHADLEPLAAFLEPEGLTLLVPKSNAEDAGIEFESVFRGIILNVHSSLDAVGLTAAISNALTAQGISANVIAAYYHDHVFVQRERAEEALAVLRELARSES